MIDANSQFFAILTNVGMAKQANADALGVPWKITEMGVGDANPAGLADPPNPVPSPAQTKLINEWRRRPLNQLKVDPVDPAIIIAEQIIPADEGGRWIREIGLYDADGDLVAVANCAPSYKPLLSQGSGRTQVVRMNFIVNNSGNITLKIDPAVVLASRAYVDAAILEVLPKNKTAGEYTRVKVNERGIVVSGDNPNTLAGYGIALATQAEAETGADNAKPMTPLRVWQAIAKVVGPATEAAFGWAKVATQVLVDAGVDDSTFVTPKKLAEARRRQGSGQCRLVWVNATTLKLIPYNGNSLVIAGVSRQIPSGGVTLSNVGLAASTLHHVHAAWVAGAMVLEAVPATAGHSQDSATGIEIKTGDATRSFVGMAYLNGSSQFADSNTARHVASWFNRRSVAGMFASSAQIGFTSTSASEVSATHRRSFLNWGDEAVDIRAAGQYIHGSAGQSVTLQSFVDGVAYGNSSPAFENYSNGGIPFVSLNAAPLSGAPLAEGQHIAQVYGAVTGGGGAITQLAHSLITRI